MTMHESCVAPDTEIGSKQSCKLAEPWTEAESNILKLLSHRTRTKVVLRCRYVYIYTYVYGNMVPDVQR